MTNGGPGSTSVIPTDAGTGDHTIPDPLTNPESFDGVLWKRVFAYWIDVVMILLILGVLSIPAMFLGILSFGLLWGPAMLLFAFVPLLYHTALIGGPRSATIGMRIMGVKVRVRDGGQPDYLRAVALTFLFYLSVMLTQWLILLVTLFNREKRTVHDMICDTVVVNDLGQG
jgi:uncharacterized RDD family membrane protein YckC